MPNASAQSRTSGLIGSGYDAVVSTAVEAVLRLAHLEFTVRRALPFGAVVRARNRLILAEGRRLGVFGHNGTSRGFRAQSMGMLGDLLVK